MQQKSLTCGFAVMDSDYTHLEKSIAERIASVKGPLFTTDANEKKGASSYTLFDLYLHYLPENVRQHYNCNTCRKFVENYGGLVEIDDVGDTVPVIWPILESLGGAFYEAVSNISMRVASARVTGVFYHEGQLGVARTGEWSHLHGQLREAWSDWVSTPEQRMAFKLEERKTLLNGLREYPLEAAVQAVRVLEADVVDRSEKFIAIAKWLLSLHEKIRLVTLKGTKRRDDLIWKAVALAPDGWCHLKTTMIGTLLDDIKAGLPFETIEQRWNAKMHPLRFQRPKTINDGNLEQANKLVEKLGAASALQRRFATISDVLCFIWQPPVEEPTTESVAKTGSPFDHLKVDKQTIKQVVLPPQRMEWQRFRDTILPEAVAIEYCTPMGDERYYGLVTAVDPTAAAIIQWDGMQEMPRNPVSWYFHSRPTTSNDWGVPVLTWTKVTGIFPKPCHWQKPELFTHYPFEVLFALEGIQEQRPQVGGSFFPEIMKSQFHAIRAAIEAYSNKQEIAGREVGNANGVCLAPAMTVKSNNFRIRVRTRLNPSWTDLLLTGPASGTIR